LTGAIAELDSAAGAGENAIELKALEGLSQGQIVRRRFFRHRGAMLAMGVLTALVALVTTSIGWGPIIPGWWKHNYWSTYPIAVPGGRPTMSFSGGITFGEHPFGQDTIGHDMFAMTMRGAQQSLTVMVLIGLLATLIGVLVGAAAGFFRGRVDTVLMRFTDMMIAIPVMVIGMVLGHWANGASAVALGLALAFVEWMAMSRLVRAEFLTLREREFVDAARVAGASSGRIVGRHILPNAVGVIIVNATLLMSAAILLETALSYLGFGIHFPDISLGNLVSEYQSAFTQRPWLFWWPGFFIIVIALCVNFIGDGLRDAFDPRQRRIPSQRKMARAARRAAARAGASAPKAETPATPVGPATVGPLPASSPDPAAKAETPATPAGPATSATTPATAPDAVEPVLRVNGLNVDFYVEGEWFPAAIDVSYQVHPGEVLAIVGESGSGKTQSSMSLIGLLPSNARVTGSAELAGRQLVGMRQSELQRIRGAQVAMVFQEPMTALNPVYTIGFQIIETIRAHSSLGPGQARQRALDLLKLVDMPEPETRIDYYPHQLSGGQRQRAMIAQALVLDPKLLIADEPTTALDVTVQAEILDLMRDLRKRIDSGIILITHDMGVVADMADRICVMKDGRIVETGSARQIFYNPRHPYTKLLLAAVPKLALGPESAEPTAERAAQAEPSAEPTTEAETKPATVQPGPRTPPETAASSKVEPTTEAETKPATVQLGPRTPPETAGSSKMEPVGAVLRAERLTLEYPRRGRTPAFRAVEDFNLTIAPGEVVGLVGESGSGKSTVGRAVVGLLPVHSGSVKVAGYELSGIKPPVLRRAREGVSIVFQDPGSSLNPRLPIGQSIGEPLALHRQARGKALSRQVEELLEQVELPASLRNRYPHELSGGQRQRVGIARALALKPKLLIADEPTSALDVSVQATVLGIFKELQREHQFACLFISHDLAVVQEVASRIAVMSKGHLVETGTTLEILQHPRERYTRELIAAVPVPDPDLQATRREAWNQRSGGRSAG
jgi:peptide/nickel transport system ATP-binding protein